MAPSASRRRPEAPPKARRARRLRPKPTATTHPPPTPKAPRPTPTWTGAIPAAARNDDEESRPQLEAHHCTLREHLMEQMRVTVLETRDRALVELIIDALDENGYLEESLEEIHARLPEELEVEIEELQTALSCCKAFDPMGVGARNASECLALQIRRLPGVPLVTRRMALAIVENHLTWFAQRDFNKLKKAAVR
jgi:RNA polymerase sigma-54 factor